jgi:hypothetical protein
MQNETILTDIAGTALCAWTGQREDGQYVTTIHTKLDAGQKPTCATPEGNDVKYMDLIITPIGRNIEKVHKTKASAIKWAKNLYKHPSP